MSNTSDGDLDTKLHLAIHAGETSEAFHMLRDRLRKVEASVARVQAINKRLTEELENIGKPEKVSPVYYCADLHKTENDGEWSCTLNRGHDGDHIAGSSAVSWPRKVGMWSLAVSEWSCGCEPPDGGFEWRDDSVVECLACHYVRPGVGIWYGDGSHWTCGCAKKSSSHPAALGFCRDCTHARPPPLPVVPSVVEVTKIGKWDNPKNSSCWRCLCAAHQLRGPNTPDCSMCGASRPPSLVGRWNDVGDLWQCGCDGGSKWTAAGATSCSCGYVRPPVPEGAWPKVGTWAWVPVESLVQNWSPHMLWVCGCGASASNRRAPTDTACPDCGYVRPARPAARIGTWRGDGDWNCGCTRLSPWRSKGTYSCRNCGDVRPAAVSLLVGNRVRAISIDRFMSVAAIDASAPDGYTIQCSWRRDRESGSGWFRASDLELVRPETPKIGTWRTSAEAYWDCGCVRGPDGGRVAQREDVAGCTECGYARPACTIAPEHGDGVAAVALKTTSGVAAIAKRMRETATAACGAFGGEWGIAAAAKAVAGNGRNIATTQFQFDANHIAATCPANTIVILDDRDEAIATAALKERKLVAVTAERDRLAAQLAQRDERGNSLAEETARWRRENERIAAELAALKSRIPQ